MFFASPEGISLLRITSFLASAALVGSAVRNFRMEKTKEKTVIDPRKAKTIFKNLRLFIAPPHRY
jgi:hypothetical protein